MSRGPGFLVILTAAYAATASGAVTRKTTQAVTPVQKVVELLSKLQKQISDEGKAEAAQYDKYSCFCKEQADGKLYAIEQSQKRIDLLGSKANQLGTEISSLTLDIQNLGRKISNLENDIDAATSSRKAEHSVYVEDAANMTAALSAIDRAIESLEHSKSNMGGKTEMEALVLASLKATNVFRASAQASSSAAFHALSGAVKAAANPGEAYEYTYHSNDIIAILQSLKAQFTRKKNEMDKEEFDANSAFEKRVLGLQNEKKFSEQEKTEKTQQSDSKTADKESAEKESADETKMMTADKDYLKVVEAECEEKALYWDQRSKARAAELTAIAKAIEIIEEKVRPNWGSNRKLVDLQSAVSPGHWVWVKERESAKVTLMEVLPERKASSFLQVRGRRDSLDATKKALKIVAAAANFLNSKDLSTAALKIELAEDHFVKVRALIKDIMERLENDKLSEATRKQRCDEQMKTQVTNRDAEKESLEQVSATISAKEAAKAQLTEQIAALSRKIADAQKALKEATELRKSEKSENERTLEMAEEGKEAVKLALSILKQFYDNAALVQSEYEPWVPENANREGKTVADLAPGLFDGDYQGKQIESNGILGLLQVILSDFDRTLQTTGTQDAASQSDFDEFSNDLDTDIANYESASSAKSSALAGVEDELVTLTDDKKDAEEKLELAIEELDKLKALCVDGEESYEQRVAKREKEIEALKEALTILDNWQG